MRALILGIDYDAYGSMDSIIQEMNMRTGEVKTIQLPYSNYLCLFVYHDFEISTRKEYEVAKYLKLLSEYDYDKIYVNENSRLEDITDIIESIDLDKESERLAIEEDMKKHL